MAESSQQGEQRQGVDALSEGEHSEDDAQDDSDDSDGDIDPRFAQLFQRESRFSRDHPTSQIVSDPSQGVQTRSAASKSQSANLAFCAFNAFVSMVEPKNIKEALQDADWIQAMQEELNQFERNKVWTLVPKEKTS